MTMLFTVLCGVHAEMRNVDSAIVDNQCDFKASHISSSEFCTNELSSPATLIQSLNLHLKLLGRGLGYSRCHVTE